MKREWIGIALVGVVLVAAAAGFGWEWSRQARKVARLQAKVAAQMAERTRLTVAGFAEVVDQAQWTKVLSRAESKREERRVALLGQGRTAPAPESSLALWFEIAAMNERLREAAASAGVRLEAGEQFGFATHRTSGPGEEGLVQVARQRRAVERLVELLIVSGAESLLAVQRERPAEEEAADSDARDFFGREEPLDSATSTLFVVTAVRLEFTGTTAALREFLNAVATDEETFLVQSVAVRPRAGAAMPGGGGEGANGGESGRPVVQPRPARFEVIVDHLTEVPSS